MRSIGIFIVLCIVTAGTTGQASAADVHVSRYGARVNDGKSDTAAIRAALDACKQKKGARLVFQKGTYDLYALPGRHKDWRGGYRTYFSLRSMERLTIEGNGAELVGHNLAGFFYATNCKDLTIRNMILDMDPLPFCGGRVIAASGKQFDLKVSPGHKALAGLRNEGVLGYDPKNRRLAVRGIDSYQTDFKKVTKIVKPGVMRAFVAKQLPRAGTDVVVRHQIYGYNAFGFKRCQDTTLQDVTVYAAGGMGVYGADSTDFKLVRFRVMIRPDSGRWMSTTADATHFNTCRGTITLENCLFEGMGDDATNLHLMYMEITGKKDKRTLGLTCKARAGQWAPRSPPRPGDKLEIGSSPNPLVPYYTATVKSVETDGPAKEIIVTFTRDLPERTAVGHTVGNASASPKARIRNCIVRNNRARGMLIQTRDVLIENNRFEYCSGSAIHIASDLNYWKEGIGVRDVVIRGNEFIGCNFGAARRGAVVDIFAEVGRKLATAGVHRGILVDGNSFKDPDGSAIHVNSADGVVIRNNTITAPRDVAIAVDHSRNVLIVGNKLLNGKKGGLKIGKKCDRRTVTARDNDGF